MRTQFIDNARYPIIAIDFDETISIGNAYPSCGKLMPYAKQVMNFMVDIGIKVVIWTSRDMGLNQDGFTCHDDLTSMIKFLDENGIKYSAINKTSHFAPFHYKGRKIYAHMYVDDRGFGWDSSDNLIMVKVLDDFLYKVVRMDVPLINIICGSIAHGEEVGIDTIETCKRYVETWKSRH